MIELNSAAKCILACVTDKKRGQQTLEAESQKERQMAKQDPAQI